MPELPEVETVVRGLEPVLKGKTIQKIAISWSRTITGEDAVFLRALEGGQVSHVSRRGKYICIYCMDRVFTVHLRMTGKLLLRIEEKERKHLRVEFVFKEGLSLYFVDTRKFGRIQLWPKGVTLLPDLGPEPLEAKTVLRVLRAVESRRAIKTVLLDQKVLAGVGNIYADEALFLAGIHPATPAVEVPLSKRALLSKKIPLILNESIKNKGTTISDYRTSEGTEGGNQFFLKVYGRKGEPCPKCRTPVERTVINQRSSHFCPSCQKPVDNKSIN
ncbi:MAG: DNA-formamidopyrimidine glycosylase [bacterium]|nr:DNA-formamidopyrimidine glycosylase [bacterium]